MNRASALSLLHHANYGHSTMPFSINLEYTPFCPQAGLPFTEPSFFRRSAPFTFEAAEVGVALVDLWNLGWDDGPVSESFGRDLSFERGRSHAMRKRHIIEDVIAPVVDTLRELGVQIFHCNHGRFLEMYPQWDASITEEERQEHWKKANPKRSDIADDSHGQVDAEGNPPPKDGWGPHWQERRGALVWGSQAWGMKQRNELYPQMAIPAPVRPKGGDLLICSKAQFRRLLAERGIRVLFYMGFETDCCVLHNQEYGIAKMVGPNCLCAIVRDATTTYESAETLEGLWRTRMAVLKIEESYGYSITSEALIEALRNLDT